MTIRITSRRDGFRRCGIEHTAEPKEYPNDRFTPEQLEQLRNEPMLIVQELPDLKADPIAPIPPGTGEENADGKQAGGKPEDEKQKPPSDEKGKK